MHLQQTKRGSRGTGGPQYYLHDLSRALKTFLRSEGAVRVALVTPYGATKSDYFAVSAVHKLGAKHAPVAGNVGHDRIQQGKAAESIGESIRLWYRLPRGDFERIQVDIEVRDDVFYVTPLAYKFAAGKREREISRIDRPLTFTRTYVSPFWTQQLTEVERQKRGMVGWSLDEICRIVQDHLRPTRLPHIQEQDLLRASGPLRHLGVELGGYVGRGYDCISQFQFLNFPKYSVPVEIKKRSSGFHYQERKYGKDELSRAVILCATHDHRTLPRHVDVVELEALCAHGGQFPL